MKLHENRSYVIDQEVKQHLKFEGLNPLDITYGGINLLADTLSAKHKSLITFREIADALDSIINE
jgi:hypothetical protein